MPRRTTSLGLLLSTALAAASCAHAPPAPAPAPAATWPDSGPPRLRWAGEFPDPSIRREPPLWRRVLDAVVGLEEQGDSGRSALVRPFGVAAAGEKLLVADPDGRRVLSVDFRTGAEEEIRCPKEWASPMAAAEAGGAVYVADAGAGLLVAVRGGRCTEIGAGLMERPAAIAASGGRLYVVDPPRHAVLVFAPGGELLSRFGSRGSEEGEVNFPTAIAAAPDGSLWVVDALNFRVSHFTADGKPLSSFGAPGDEKGEFSRPKAVAVDGRGRLYVSDAQRDAVLVFGPDGQFQYSFGETGSDPGQLSLPAGVAVAGDRVFVADSYNHRVQQFAMVEGAP